MHALVTLLKVVVVVSQDLVHETEVPKIKYELVVDGSVYPGIVKVPEHELLEKHPYLTVYS